MKGAIIMDITTIKYPSHNDLVQWYYQLAQRIAESAGVTPEDVNALIEAYIEEHPYPVVPADVITASNAAQNVVTSVNGEKGAVTGVSSVNGQTGVVTVAEVPSNVITGDNIAGNAVTSFNGGKGDIDYTPPVTSVNGMTGNVYTPIYRSSSTGSWAYGIRINSAQALIFTWLHYTFEGYDISYNTTIPEDLAINPIVAFSWLPGSQSFSAATGAFINTEARTIKIMVDDPDSVTPPNDIWAGCVLYGSF